MTAACLTELRSRVYEADATQRALCGGNESAALVHQRGFQPLLVRLSQVDDFRAEGINISTEQAALAPAAGVTRVRRGDSRDTLAAHRAYYAAIMATDLIEHLAKTGVLQTFDKVARALAPGDVLMGRTPNAITSPGGDIRNGEFIHQTMFTARSIHQSVVAAA